MAGAIRFGREIVATDGSGTERIGTWLAIPANAIGEAGARHPVGVVERDVATEAVPRWS